MADVIVLGAGIVGVSTAVQLAQRGNSVLLVDRREPGRETSYGNSGVIQAEGVLPHSFPRDLASLWSAATGGGLDVRYDPLALPGLAPALARYWWHSEPRRYAHIVAEYAPLIANALPEHARLIEAAAALELIRKDGWYVLLRTQKGVDEAFAAADSAAQHGVKHEKLDADAVAKVEPEMRIRAAGAVHWTEPWTVKNPAALVDAYVRLFKTLGGTVAIGDGRTVRQEGAGWSVTTVDGQETAPAVVLAMGPWAAEVTKGLGYRLPLFVKRGYHMHYAGSAPRNWVIDAERGYLLAPMQQGVRLTTGAEFAGITAPQNPAQLDGAERVARTLFPLGERLDKAPWMGARPCTPDMKPIIGPAPRHKGLWLAIGHAHHGLTLGAVTGRLIAEMIGGERPFLDVAAFSADRFGG